MAHLIDKDALVAEIEKRIEEYKSMKIDSSYYDGMIASLEFLRDEFIDTLEVKEVDLDDEIERKWEDSPIPTEYWLEFERLCKHFFELGLKAQKGEEV